ncbi:hypothetical protein NEOLI_000744 [Neolecta irregularis DAH-3]|uniref:Uncharacterized protein n=1 Tax=Neolecta irregularis (strain DAH-3) TaxID=1198029 RepID=A0A1U7LWK6_NEOID|nr:hypothetical protein NEOLI_000744 [Neolecta irregularis DAH-3]|eukprot:OLL26953.1 hypothetical protein NEOLI_000744 [Neolecta irregularis DAH-3]
MHDKSPFLAVKFISCNVGFGELRIHLNVPFSIEMFSSPRFETAGSRQSASCCNSSALRKLVNLCTATLASIIDVIMIGRNASGKDNKLNKASAGKTI